MYWTCIHSSVSQLWKTVGPQEMLRVTAVPWVSMGGVHPGCISKAWRSISVRVHSDRLAFLIPKRKWRWTWKRLLEVALLLRSLIALLDCIDCIALLLSSHHISSNSQFSSLLSSLLSSHLFSSMFLFRNNFFMISPRKSRRQLLPVKSVEGSW